MFDESIMTDFMQYIYFWGRDLKNNTLTDGNWWGHGISLILPRWAAEFDKRPRRIWQNFPRKTVGPTDMALLSVKARAIANALTTNIVVGLDFQAMQRFHEQFETRVLELFWV
jgi:hypothetical protein